MTDKDQNAEYSNPSNDPAPSLTKSPAAQRALAEAAQRRKNAPSPATPPTKEVGGGKGPEPTRFGDWERSGITHDF